MAYPYLIGPGGQPFIIQQVPLIQQQVSVIPQQQVLPQQTQPVPPKVPDYMSEEKLQEKGKNEEESKFYTKCVYVLLLYLVLPFCSLDNLFDWISSRMCCNLCLEPLIIYYLYTPDYLHLHVIFLIIFLSTEMAAVAVQAIQWEEKVWFCWCSERGNATRTCQENHPWPWRYDKQEVQTW